MLFFFGHYSLPAFSLKISVHQQKLQRAWRDCVSYITGTNSQALAQAAADHRTNSTAGRNFRRNGARSRESQTLDYSVVYARSSWGLHGTV